MVIEVTMQPRAESSVDERRKVCMVSVRTGHLAERRTYPAGEDQGAAPWFAIEDRSIVISYRPYTLKQLHSS